MTDPSETHATTAELNAVTFPLMRHCSVMKKKLNFGRETIRNLESAQLRQIAGGAGSGAMTCSCPGTPTAGVCTTNPSLTCYTAWCKTVA